MCATEWIVMAITITPTEQGAFTVLRGFLLTYLPLGMEVIQGQVNRVPTPTDSYVTITPLRLKRLATNETHYNIDLQRTEVNSLEWAIQADIYGNAACDNAVIIATLFRSDIAYDNFISSGLQIVPLYAEDLRQMRFITGETQYENRWSIDLLMQIKPSVTIVQQSALHVNLGLIEVDTTYQ